MRLRNLIKNISSLEVFGSKEVGVRGISSHSKQVGPGYLFIAKRGMKTEGHRYIADAVASGAVAILTDLYDPTLKGVTQMIHSDVASIEGEITAQFYQCPSDELFTIGVTGTSGKTTTSYLVKSLLDQAGTNCGLIGTIEYIVGTHRFKPTHTTPDVTANQKMLREMVNQGLSAVVMEVTSHALDQKRVACIDYDVGVFTNLTPEHLDYHKDMDAYARAKQNLFKVTKRAVVNGDDPNTEKVLGEFKGEILTYGVGGNCDLRASDLELTQEGSLFTLHYQKRDYAVKTPLVGKFNVYNALAALGVALFYGIELDKAIEYLERFFSVPGRLEPVSNRLGLGIYVDFAHKSDALENVLCSLLSFKKGKIITVFGAGGDRDRTKRPVMGEIVERYSDEIVVTTDNPRSEDPAKIAEEILKGIKGKAKVILDRREAIRYAIEKGEKGDIILIAGRGHERFQTFAHNTLPFNDRKVASEVCAELESEAACTS